MMASGWSKTDKSKTSSPKPSVPYSKDAVFPLSTLVNKTEQGACVYWNEKELLKEREGTGVYVRAIDVDQGNFSTSLKYFEQTNRMIHRYGSTNFIIINFSRKLEAVTVRNILRGGIVVNGEKYEFVGCSSGGLKSRTCYMFKGSLQDVHRVWTECGAFSLIKSRYKRLKRIGLLFSSAMPTGIEVSPSKVQEIPDIESASHNYTDGCGAISRELANQLIKRCKIRSEPSVFQIRYQGCKGVVAIDNTMEGIKLAIRPSMKKFQPGTKPFNELWLCDFSRPYSFGHLNRQFITLLSSLGVSDEAFLSIQSEHFQRLENMTCSVNAAFEMLVLDNQSDLAMHFTDSDFLVKCSSQLKKLRSKALAKLEKLRLPMLKSRNVFGVCDTTGKLKYGHCYFRFTDQGRNKTLEGSIVVAKNPCYMLGDVRVLTAVDIEGLDHLIDCIVFPTRGKRPHPSEIAGSDLDGDQYFVCWDKDLAVLKLHNPYDYPSVDVPETNTNITQDVLIDFFAGQRNNMAKIDSYYKYWANKKGAGCKECQTLGQLFSRSVDATKTGDTVFITPNLVPPLEPAASESDEKSLASVSSTRQQHVWEIMEKRACEKKQEISKEVISKEDDMDVLTEDFLWNLVENRIPNITEFQLLELIFRWCSSQHSSEYQQKFLEFARHIRFGQLTLEEQVAAINLGVPLERVTNALNQSTLPESLLKKFSLDDPHRNWRFYFNASSVDFKWEHLLRGIQTHPESLIVIRLSDEVTFVLHFLSRVTVGESDLGSDTVVAYFSSEHFNLNLQTTLGSEYKITLDEDKLQIYQGEKRGTFIWLSREREAKQPNHRGKTQDIDILFDRISVDLTRFKKNVLRSDNHPKVNKQCFLGIEMFVKSESNQSAYLDYVEADFQSDYPVDEPAVTEGIDKLPDEMIDSEDCIFLECLIPDSEEEAIAVIAECAIKGNILSFKEALKVVHSRDEPDMSKQLLFHFSELLDFLLIKYCHINLSDRVEDCLCSIINAFKQHKASTTLALQLLSVSAKLRLFKLLDLIFDAVLPSIETTKVREYLEVVSKWQSWYSLPSRIARRFSESIYEFFSSLLDQPEKVPALAKLIEFTSDPASEISIQQHEAERYSFYFSRLIHNHLLSEMYGLKDQQECSHDTTTSIAMMRCYDFVHPHDALFSSDAKEDEDNIVQSWKIGFSRSSTGINSKNFTAGSFVSINLMTKSASTTEKHSIPIAMGCIVKASRHPADVVVEVTEPVPLCLKKSVQANAGHWELTLVGNITLFNRSLKALKTIQESSNCTALLALTHKCVYPQIESEINGAHHQRELSTHDHASSMKQLLTKESHSDLNQNQEKAVSAALRQRLTLIHGPPGTGKTHVACEIVQKQLSKNENCPILVVAETNMAVDNLCEKLLSRDIRVIRIGKLEQISPPLREVSLESQIEKKRIQESRDKKRSQYLSKAMIKPIIKAAQVVAATCTSAGDSTLKGIKFPFVVVDEATQVTEPTSLIPLVYGCQQLTLIGDPEQLAPTVTVSRNTDFHIEDLSVTLFHRLQKLVPQNCVFLNEQYRMHPKLVEFPSVKFYKGRLVTAKSRLEQRSIFQEPVPFIKEEAPHVFVKVEENEKRVGTSFCNPAEARVVTRVIKCLIRYNISSQQMVVLTPYSGQRKCILNHFQEEKICHVKLHTIDSFQGREADVVIFSAVRCNSAHELGFMNDRYRMNVLLTRARHCLIGIGSHNSLSNGSLWWNEWIETVNVIEEEKLSTENSGNKGSSEAGPRPKEKIHDSRGPGVRTSGETRRTSDYSSSNQRGRHSQRGRGSNRGNDFSHRSYDRGGHRGSYYRHGEFDEHQLRSGVSRGGYRGRGRRHGQSSYSRSRDQ